MPLPVSAARSTRRSWPRPRDRLRAALADADPRDAEVPVVANVDALPHHARRRVGEPAAAQLSSPVRWRQSLLELCRPRGHRRSSSSVPARVLTGMVKRTAPGARAVACRRPSDLDTLLEVLRIEAPARSAHHEGEHLFATERLVVSPAAGVFAPAADVADGAARSTPGPCSATSAATRCARRSPECSRAARRAPASASPPASPIAWLRTA